MMKKLEEQLLWERLGVLERKVDRLERLTYRLQGKYPPENVNPYDLSKHGGRSR